MRSPRWTGATAHLRAAGRARVLVTGLVAVVLVAGVSAASPGRMAPASTERSADAPPEDIESGDEDHFDDEPRPVSPDEDLAAGLNDIGDDSPWAGLWGPEIEPLATYEPQGTCMFGARPAVAAFASLLARAYPQSRNLGITRACAAGARSEHKEGRAYDWGVNVSVPAERDAAHQMLAWLLATDEHGNEYAMARRLGVMYVIWDNHIWSSSAADAGWRVYRGASPHTDHVHLSFNRAGAMGQTSFWDISPFGFGPGMFDGFSLDDFPAAIDLGRDRYRPELGAAAGRLIPWDGSETDGEEPAGSSDAAEATTGDDEEVAPTAPATAPSEAVPTSPTPAPVESAPDTAVVDPVVEPILDPVEPIIGPLLPEAPTTTTTTVPLVDDVTGIVEDTAGSVGDGVDPPAGG